MPSSSPTEDQPSLSEWLQAKDTNKAETTTNMLISHPPQPVPQTIEGDMTGNSVLRDGGVMKLDDFLATHKDEHASQILARETSNTSKHIPPSKKPKTNENAAPLRPVAVGARSSKYTILLHEKYQALGIPQPLFTYGGGSDLGWTVSVSFPGLDVEELQGVSEEGRFNSKQEAKEAVSKRAMGVLEELQEAGKVKKGEKRKGKDKSVGAVQQQKEEMKEQGENYVGQLLEFQRSTSSPQPTYTEYQSGTRFACLLTIDGHPDPFGSLSSLHSSKKAARQDAARHAVQFFKDQGTWPQDVTPVGGIKKKKAPQPSLPEDITDTTTTTGNANMSFPQRVATLAHALSLPTPEWRYTAHPADKDFHSVSCFFRNAGPHEGPIGEVRNIFGKKKAKEECARLTLEYLLEVRETRVSYGVKMMEGITGGEGVVGVAAGRAVDGEGDEDEEFEDAVEEM